jgi:phosphatidylinositol alpha 1,6-mannosyltransferase
VRHGENGFLFDPADDAALRAGVERLCGDAALRARMGEAGRRSVIGRSWRTVCDELLGHYASVIAARRTQSVVESR